MSARDEILGALRRSLAQPGLRFPPADPPPLDGDTRMAVTAAAGTGRALAERFGAELDALHGSHEIVASAAAARDAVVRRVEAWLATGEAPRRVLAWEADSLPLPGVGAALAAAGIELFVPVDLQDREERASAEQLLVGVTGAAAAFASTGSLLMVAEPGRSRAASLLPLFHLVLVPWSRLYPTMEAWLRAARAEGQVPALLRTRANFSLISGPSKSADIEMNLTLGVHGPREVHAILWEDGERGDAGGDEGRRR